MNVIVYDLPGDPGLEYHVPDPWVLQLTVGQGSSLADALASVAQQALPLSAANLVFTTDDQLPTLAQVRNRKTAALRAACQAAIFAGFASAALGASFLYPAGETDQRNLIASVTASLLPGLPASWTTPFWCADEAGAWALRDHTVAQIQQAGLDCKAFVVAQQQKLATLLAQVAAADTADAVAAIVW